MNSQPDFRVSHSLDLLDRLTRTVAEFAEREEQTLRFFHNQRNTATRRRSAALQAIEQSTTQAIERLEAARADREEQARAFHTRRAARISQAQSNGLRSVFGEATRAKERWLGELQLRHFEAKKALPLRQKAAQTDLAAVHARLTDGVTQFELLRNRAARFFAGYLSFARLLQLSPETSNPSNASAWDRDRLLAEFESALREADADLAAFRRLPLPFLFSLLPPVIFFVLIILGAGILAATRGFDAAAFREASVIAAVVIVIMVVLHIAGHASGKPRAKQIAAKLAETARLHAACAAAAQTRCQQELDAAQQDYDRVSAEIHTQWKRADDIEMDFSRDARTRINSKVPRLQLLNDRKLQTSLASLQSTHQRATDDLRTQAEQQRVHSRTAHDLAITQIVADEEAVWNALEAEWSLRVQELYALLEALRAGSHAVPWTAQAIQQWQPATEFTPAVRFAHLELDLAASGRACPKRLGLPGSPLVSIPLALAFPAQGSLRFETHEGGIVAAEAFNNVLLRLLTEMPPGKVSLTILDPVGLGQNFAGLMHLGDYEEGVINRRIWTQRDQIDERLTELSAHIEKVIQMYLRNEYATITQYNSEAGSVAEKYQFLVVADFPAGFTESSARRLQSIISSGPRCGVFTLIHWDGRQPLPDGFSADDLRAQTIGLLREHGGWTLGPTQAQSGAALVLDPPPDAELALQLVHRIGQASIDSNRVEVPFTSVAPGTDAVWTGDTTTELRVAIGRTGATKLQFLAIGKGTRQHALFAGKTGSGKSTLFHVIITNLALTCSPEQVEFYLIDFKKGVEFKCYATHQLPHARVVAIESDREFGLSVLHRVDEELKRRGDLFRKLGVQDVPGYRRVGGSEAIPRTLLIIDEFQEFFVQDDEIAQTASLLFDRIVRQGRAFGIHVLLGSQTLGGAYTLARATLGQMAIRVALQCNEADAYLIMDENNSAPRLLSRPGEGIYNDAAGATEGNSPFQVVWLPDEERDRWLERVSTIATERQTRNRAPIVFEGNAPADVRENADLAALLAAPATAPTRTPRFWLGAPNSIKGPTEVVFRRQSGNHLLIIGQRDESALTLLGLALRTLAAQFPVGTVRFAVIHGLDAGSADAAFLDRTLRSVPHPVTCADGSSLSSLMTELGADLKSRIAGDAPPDVPTTFLLIHGLQRFKKLRQEDDFSFSSSSDEASPGAVLADLIVEGSSHGMHLLAAVDTFNNVGRFLSRKALSEIEMRVLFQMSANDSASLIDSPKASALGLHRAILYNEQQGSTETFRPYAMPEPEWFGQV